MHRAAWGGLGRPRDPVHTGSLVLSSVKLLGVSVSRVSGLCPELGRKWLRIPVPESRGNRSLTASSQLLAWGLLSTESPNMDEGLTMSKQDKRGACPHTVHLLGVRALHHGLGVFACVKGSDQLLQGKCS